jgi:CubicO group peptidase (beta-lactamase class C family)
MKFVVANFDGKTPLSRVFDSMQKTSNRTSIGWMQPGFIERFFGNKTTIWHNGMVGGYASYVAVDLQTKSGVVLLSSKAVDVTMLGIMLVRQARTQSRE